MTFSKIWSVYNYPDNKVQLLMVSTSLLSKNKRLLITVLNYNSDLHLVAIVHHIKSMLTTAFLEPLMVTTALLDPV